MSTMLPVKTCSKYTNTSLRCKLHRQPKSGSCLPRNCCASVAKPSQNTLQRRQMYTSGIYVPCIYNCSTQLTVGPALSKLIFREQHTHCCPCYIIRTACLPMKCLPIPRRCPLMTCLPMTCLPMRCLPMRCLLLTCLPMTCLPSRCPPELATTHTHTDNWPYTCRRLFPHWIRQHRRDQQLQLRFLYRLWLPPKSGVL